LQDKNEDLDCVDFHGKMPLLLAKRSGRIFMKFDILSIFRKSVYKIQASLKSDKNNGHFTWRRMYNCDSI